MEIAEIWAEYFEQLLNDEDLEETFNLLKKNLIIVPVKH